MRDHIDTTRSESPLRQAEDAVFVDNSMMTLDEQVELVVGQQGRVGLGSIGHVVHRCACGAQAAQQHSGALPHCCLAGCAMLGGAPLPGLAVLAWLLPGTPQVLPAATIDIHFSSAQARLPRQPRAPPLPV